MNTLSKIQQRMDAAKKLYGQYASLHEVMGVLQEEFREAEIELHKSDWTALRKELLDIAAVCIRANDEITMREKYKQI